MPGTLYVVATPIGNLEDLTFRALRTLKEVDLIAAEDTRRTSKLLAHYGVSKPLVSLHEHNEFRAAPGLVDRLTAGESIALVSDAGTPGISDPGAKLVRLARSGGVPVVPIPGASAVATALSISGLDLESFVFLGFPPATGAARTQWFEALDADPRVSIFFEAPHRIRRTLREAKDCLATRQISIARELTKIHEELVEYNNKSTSEQMDSGEFVVIVHEKTHGESSSTDPQAVDRAVELFGLMIDKIGMPNESALLAVSAATGVPSLKLKNLVKKAAIEAKRLADSRPTPLS